MNLILGNLTLLKSAVLPAALRTGTDWDVALAALASGVAAAMEGFCNRKFARLVGDTFERSANCTYLSLPRFPVESIASIELKVDEQQGFIALPSNTVLTLNKASGLAEFGSSIGGFTDRLRATYTGGFYADYTEDSSGTIPVGATAVPPDLLHAWHLQVQHEIEATNLLRGVAAKRSADKQDRIIESAELKLIARVREMLRLFVRFS